MTQKLPREQLGDDILAALRRIIRAVDLQSRQLVRSHGLTGPQALLLKEITLAGELTVGQLADRVSLSQATVTDILLRLEKRGLIERQRSREDKRRVLVHITVAGRRLMKHSLPLLQEAFLDKLNQLQEWEQTQLLASLQRLADMMNAQTLEADNPDDGYAADADNGDHPLRQSIQ
ncbi:MAG: MarR family transcriptional regulator [Gammaproteobacteria bacterium]|nr:MarR family transcriptional regulator [Gammaproteobacteria bacterium]